jgi:hypothetical protein
MSTCVHLTIDEPRNNTNQERGDGTSTVMVKPFVRAMSQHQSTKISVVQQSLTRPRHSNAQEHDVSNMYKTNELHHISNHDRHDNCATLHVNPRDVNHVLTNAMLGYLCLMT